MPVLRKLMTTTTAQYQKENISVLSHWYVMQEGQRLRMLMADIGFDIMDTYSLDDAVFRHHLSPRNGSGCTYTKPLLHVHTNTFRSYATDGMFLRRF